MKIKVILALKSLFIRYFLSFEDTTKNIHAIYYNFLSFYKVRNRAYNLVYNS